MKSSIWFNKIDKEEEKNESPYLVISALEKMDDINSNAIRKAFRFVIFSSNEHALYKLLKFIRDHKNEIELKEAIENIFEDDVSFFCKAVDEYVNHPFGGYLQISPQGLLIQSWILSEKQMEKQSVNTWIGQIKKFSKR